MTQRKESPEELEARIDETRSAIAGDIRELGEKLSPENLKAGAKHMLQDAKEEAKDALRGAKDAAVDSLITAKDHALESVAETAYEVGDRARRAGVATASFVTANAVPLTLIGLGAGWLMLTMRRQRRMRTAAPYAIDYAPYGTSGGYQTRIERSPESWEQSSFGTESHNLIERGREKFDALSERAREGTQHMRDRAREGTTHMRDRVQSTASHLGERAAMMSHDARERFVRAEQRTVEFATDNPLAMGALAVVAGVGIGMALPPSRVENRLLGPTRGRITDEARGLMNDARSGAQQAAQMAREAASEIKSAVTQSQQQQPR